MSAFLLSEIVQFLGLSPSESAVYEFLLYQKEVNVSKIAKETRLNRLQVYDIFEKLQLLGLVTKPKGRTTQIQLVNPKTLVIKLREKQLQAEKYQKQIQDILPSLEQSFGQNNSSIPLRLVEGKQDFEELFLEMYESATGEILFVGNADTFYNFLDKNYVDYAISKRASKRISHRVLAFLPGLSLQKLAEFEARDLRQVRYLPAGFDNLGYVNIYDNKVVNWNPALARAVIVEDPIIASFYRTIFEVLWELTSSKDFL